MINTFRFGESKLSHKIGHTQCPACRWAVPTRCELCKEGLVHIELNPKGGNIEDIFILKCDVCHGQGQDWIKGFKMNDV